MILPLERDEWPEGPPMGYHGRQVLIYPTITWISVRYFLGLPLKIIPGPFK